MNGRRLTVSPYGNAKDDLFYWIKSYISLKIYDLKQDSGYDLDKTKIYYQLFNTSTIEEFKKKQFEIRSQGLSTLRTYVTPLVSLYDYFIETTSIQQITDFNTEYRDNIFLEKNKGYSYSTNLVHFVQINSLFKHIEKVLSETQDAEKYTFDIVNKIENNKLIYPFHEDTNKPIYIKSNEIFHLISMANTFKYRGDAISKVKLMLKLVIFGGLSGTELGHLTKDNIQVVKNPHQLLKGFYLKLQIKYPKEIVVYINYDLIEEEYSTYNLDYHSANNQESYFYTEDGKIYSPSSIYQQFERLMNHASIECDNSITSFLKYGYAVFLANNNVDPSIISLLFGGKTKIKKIVEDITDENLRNNPTEIIACWDNF